MSIGGLGINLCEQECLVLYRRLPWGFGNLAFPHLGNGVCLTLSSRGRMSSDQPWFLQDVIEPQRGQIVNPGEKRQGRVRERAPWLLEHLPLPEYL